MRSHVQSYKLVHVSGVHCHTCILYKCLCFCVLYCSALYGVGLPCSSAAKKSTCNAGDPCSIPGSGRSPGEETSHLLQYPWVSLVAQICLQCQRPGINVWDGKIPWRRAWQPTPVFLPGELPWTEEPGGATVHRVAKSQTQLSG